MADVARLPSVWEQLRLVAGLRWIILKNGLRRKQNVWDLIGIIFAGFFSAMLVLGLSFAFFAGGYAFVKKGFDLGFVLLFWAIFLWWQLFPIFVAGFGGNFAFRSLLRFPLSLRAFYLLGLGYGLADFGALSAICWLIATGVGVFSAEPTAAPAFALASVVFALLNITMERLIGSWLEKILARRRSRELFVGLFILCMVSLNFLNPLVQRYGAELKPKVTEFMRYLAWTPGSLAGRTASAGVSGDFAAGGVALAALLAWLIVLSALLWFRFKAQYLGEEISESMAPAATRRIVKHDEQGGVELAGFLPAPVLSVAVKEFHYLMRNGFAFLTLIVPPMMVVFFSMQFAGKNSALKEHALKPEMFFPGMMAYLILVLMSGAYNSFAYEGCGIQTYFMAPIRMQDVLRGKNLFLAVMVATELLLCMVVLIWRIGWPSPAVVISTLAAATFAVAGQFTIANWSSLSFPRKMEIGKMRGQRNSGLAVWIAFGVQIVLGAICVLIYFAGRWMGNPWLSAVLFVGLTAAALGGYRASLRALDRLGEEKKELLIETLCK